MSLELSDAEISNDSFSDCSQYSATKDEETHKEDNKRDNLVKNYKYSNIVSNLLNRQIYGRFTANPKAKTEQIFNNVHYRCKIKLSSLISEQEHINHIFMGFTLCGQFFITLTEKYVGNVFAYNFLSVYEYELYLWRFSPGEKLKFVSKHRIFKHERLQWLDKVMFMQFPMDPYKVLCYGNTNGNPAVVYITILTLPFPKSCKHCTKLSASEKSQGWCTKHGFILHYMFAMSHPCPNFDPQISLSYPDNLVINTGHYIHIVNIRTTDPPKIQQHKTDDCNEKITVPNQNFNDTLSEVSESAGSDNFSTNSVVEAILDDFNEYDSESNAELSNKPFHELNISCEPLNVTGKSYHNTLVQNIVDPRIKRLQTKDYQFPMPQPSASKDEKKIDKKQAEKAYEFIEENEKYEKLSSFRKKRLAEKKYEFSEDNSENIVPFNSLRKERRFFRSASTNSDFFLSPRSPMQSPNSNSKGQFSPSNRNLYGTIRNSPISPKDTMRKFYVYSPSLDSDCSDNDSKLILRLNPSQLNGLLIISNKETPKWIKKVVRRYSNGDFENGSLLSGQSRDDYNIPIEIPLSVETLTEQHLEAIPDFKLDQVMDMQLIVTQRTFDLEQFVQRRVQQLCAESELQFLHCQDYDIKIKHVCPLDGHIICQGVIKMAALKENAPFMKPEHYTTHCLFTWNIATDIFELFEVNGDKLQLSKDYEAMPVLNIPKTNCNGVLVLDYHCGKTKTVLRDYNNFYEICLDPDLDNPYLNLLQDFSADSD